MAKKRTKEVFNMTAIAEKIDKAINSPQKAMTEDDAKSVLQKYGIIDSQGQITPAFKDILTKAEKDNGAK